MNTRFYRFASAKKIISYAARACLVSSLLPIATPAHSQGFGTITPGGVQPNLERREPPKATQQPEYEIPSVPERPLDSSDGPRLIVERFQLEGAADIEGSDFSQREVSLLLEEARRSQPQGFTIGELQALANQVTQYCRQHGLILALAIVPEQEIENGVVTISILPGQLGALSTANNSKYADDLMTRPLQPLLDKPVQAAQIESALLSLNDIPGLEATGIFRPGAQVGETELVLNATEEDSFQYLLIADNYGVETTGTTRLIGGVTWNNPFGIGDRLSVKALQTFDPDDSTYGSINYETRVVSPKLLAGISYSINDYVISQSLGIIQTDGDTEITSLYGKYIYARSRDFNLTGVFDLSTKRAEVSFPDFGAAFGEDKLTVTSIGFQADSIDRRLSGGINKVDVFYSQGIPDFLGSMDRDGDGNSLRIGGSLERAGGDFQKIAFRLQRLQLVNPTNMIDFKLQGQFSDDLLSSIEQFSMGGPNSVRAYPVSEYVRDKAIFASAEWIIDAPGFNSKPAFNGRTWGEVLSVSLFYDYAKGRNNDPFIDSENNQSIGGVGLGIEFKPSDNAFLKFEAATPTSSQDASNGDDPQLWLSAGIEL